MDLDPLTVPSRACVVPSDPAIYRLVNIRPRDILAGFVGHDTGIPVIPFLGSLVGQGAIDAELPPTAPNEYQGGKVRYPVGSC